jgi:hypothetical protein
MLDVSQMDLRELAQAYAEGLIDFEQYRHARTQLLDRVTGEATIVVREPTRPMQHSYRLAQAEEAVAFSRVYGHVPIWLLIASAIVLILVVWLVVE